MTHEDAPASAPVSLFDSCGWYGHRPPAGRSASAPLPDEEAYDFVL